MQGEKQYKTGLDVGSTTAKIVIIDESGQTVFSRYERHNAQVNDLLSAYFREARQELGDIETSIAVTGSVGMGTAEQLRTEFIQEVVAATRYAQQLYPSASALIDIGGEDAKVVLFQGNHIDLRMNGNCAGGTGAFIDQMAVLLGVDIEELSRLALQAEHIHPIAARCGVFSKTDIQNLVSRNVPLGDIGRLHFPCRCSTNHRNIIARLDIPPAYSIMRRPLDFHSSLTKGIRRLSAFTRERLYSSCRRKPSSRIRLCPMCHGRKSSFFIDIGKSHIPKHQYHNKKQPTSAIRFRNGL